jgi:catechol 2,3-dioxygenase-like lactoylglutathione lyase family enzyme
MILDHFTLRTQNLAAARAFFEQVFDLRDGFRPDFPFPGHWLYEGAEPIVHLMPAQAGASDSAAVAERIDHVAFLRDDYDAFRAKLDRLSISYSPMELPELGERRLFLQVPGGVLLEVAFRSNRI